MIFFALLLFLYGSRTYVVILEFREHLTQTTTNAIQNEQKNS